MEKAKREMRFRFGENSRDASDASRPRKKKEKKKWKYTPA